MKIFLLSLRVLVITRLFALQISPSDASEGNTNSAFSGFDKPFVVNLTGSDNLTYLQVNVQF